MRKGVGIICALLMTVCLCLSASAEKAQVMESSDQNFQVSIPADWKAATWEEQEAAIVEVIAACFAAGRPQASYFDMSRHDKAYRSDEDSGLFLILLKEEDPQKAELMQMDFYARWMRPYYDMLMPDAKEPMQWDIAPEVRTIGGRRMMVLAGTMQLDDETVVSLATAYIPSGDMVYTLSLESYDRPITEEDILLFEQMLESVNIHETK